MPYFIRKRGNEHCVVKGTKDNPGETVKCHPTKEKARAHLGALYVHVEDVQKEGIARVAAQLGGQLFAYKEDDADRWIAISTIDDWDKQGELFTKEAMDSDIARVDNGGEYPEARMFHVRGFKLGVCDSMQRIEKWAVDQGRWLNTPFAQWMKGDVIDNPGKWKISRGFYSVRATGQCPGCGTGLVVGPWNYIFGVRCTACKELHSSPSGLKRLKHLRAITFDITLTDVPAVSGTAVAAYSISSVNEGGQ